MDVRDSFLDAAQFVLNGPSRANRDHREVLPQSLSRCHLTCFLVQTYAYDHLRYVSYCDVEVDRVPAVATVDGNQSSEKASMRSQLSSIVVVKYPSRSATTNEHHALEETKATFPQPNDDHDDLVACMEGVTDARTDLLSIA